MINISSAMAVQFAEAVEDMTQQVRELGPNPLQDARDSDSEE
jgi:coenzyme F420-reducing hydrogenase delta subunit